MVSPRKVILVVLATVVIFAAGVVTGGLVARKSTAPAPASFPFWGRFEAMHRAIDQLALRPDQRGRIHRIIRDNQELIGDYFKILEPDMQDVFQKMRRQINAELTPEQRQRFEEVMRQRFRRPGERRPLEGFRGPNESGPIQPEGPKPPPLNR